MLMGWIFEKKKIHLIFSTIQDWYCSNLICRTFFMNLCIDDYENTQSICCFGIDVLLGKCLLALWQWHELIFLAGFTICLRFYELIPNGLFCLSQTKRWKFRCSYNILFRVKNFFYCFLPVENFTICKHKLYMGVNDQNKTNPVACISCYVSLFICNW